MGTLTFIGGDLKSQQPAAFAEYGVAPSQLGNGLGSAGHSSPDAGAA